MYFVFVYGFNGKWMRNFYLLCVHFILLGGVESNVNLDYTRVLMPLFMVVLHFFRTKNKRAY
jgi:hypothetical protein